MVIKKIANIEYSFEHGEVNNDTLYGVSIHPVTTNIQMSFLTQLPERNETAQGFHQQLLFNGFYRRKLRMDQQHCSYSTILNDKVKRRKPEQKKKFQNMHPVCNKSLK